MQLKSCLLTVFLAAFMALNAMDLLKNGQYQVKAVVIAPDATRTELHAANELRLHMAKVAKSPMPELLKDDGKLPEGKFIYLGKAAAKRVTLPEKMVKSYGEIHVKDGNIYICGKDDATGKIRDSL